MVKVVFMKRFLKVLGFGVLVLCVAFGMLVARNWSSLRIMMSGRQLSGSVAPVPEAMEPDAEVVGSGAADWICWRGPDGSGKSLVPEMPRDLQSGLTRIWDVDDLCQGEETAAWWAPVVANARHFLRFRQTLVCFEMTP